MTTVTQLTEKATSKYAQTSWIRIHYNEAGSGEPPVIFLHGSGPGASSWSNFQHNVGALSQHHRCLLVDQPGYGKTDSYVVTEPRSVVNARAVKDLMEVLRIPKASLVGNSLGGISALAFAVDYPERVEKLVLMGSPPGASVSLFTISPTEGLKVLEEAFAHPTLENMRRLFNIMLYDGSSVSDEVLKARFETLMSNPSHIEARAKSSTAPRNLLLDLPKVQAPTLLIHGRQDRVVPLESSLMLLSLIPNSSLHVFNKCGHWAQFEHAEKFNRLVEDFLSH